MSGSGSKQDPWVLKTPPGTSEYTMWRDDASEPAQIVCQVGSTKLLYDARGDRRPACLAARARRLDSTRYRGRAEPAKDGTVEAWGRSASNPLGGWYGLRKGYRGRVGMYVPPLLEELGLAEVEHGRATTGCGPSERTA